MPGRRIKRAQDLIREEVSRLLLFKAKDPRLKSVSVTQVEMTADLRRAMVYYSIFNDQADRGEIQALLDKAAGFFRREISRAVELKYVPEIRFEFDKSIEYAQHMDQVFSHINSAAGVDNNGDSD